MAGFHGHGHAHAGHYGVPAASHYESLGHSGLPFVRQRPMRAPVLAPAGFNHQHTGQHQHPHLHSHGRIANLTMADPTYMPSDEELAHLQKLSSEYEPEATVSVCKRAVDVFWTRPDHRRALW
jgi:ubiquitin thioesterase protein OTUB1